MMESHRDDQVAKSGASFQPVHGSFQEQAARTPDAAAVVFDGKTFSFRELDSRSDRLAARLQRLGVTADTGVGVRLPRGVNHLIALLGVHKAGGMLVPVSSVSTIEPPERMAYILENARIKLMLTERALGSIAPHIEHVAIDDLESSAPGAADPPPSITINADDLAYVIYTSGSTGRPKGCAMPHRGLSNLVAWQQAYSPGSPGLRTLQFNALSFDLCFQEIFPTWAVGGTLIGVPESARRDPDALLDLVIRERVARMILPFVGFRQLAEQAELTGRAMPDLREVYVGGEALQLTPAIRSLFRRNTEASLINVYGPTEAHIVTAYRVPGAPDEWPAVAPIGSPIRGTHLYLVNSAGQSVPAGVPGEVLIGGDVIVRGYLHNARATAERFIPDRFAKVPGSRVYRTGDRVRKLPSGALEFVGRTDHQVKIRGFRVEPGEVESILASHPGIRQVVVQGRNDTGETRLVAYVVARTAPLSMSEIRSFLTNKLPDEMIPTALVSLAELPQTADGKVNLKALPAPASEVRVEDDEYVAPRDDEEKLLAGIWQDVLKLERVGINDHFFEIGGHSLHAFQVTARLRDLLSIQIPIVEIFQSPTVAELAESLRRVRSRATPTKPAVTRSASLSSETLASPIQHVMFRMNREAPNIPMENQDASLRLRGPLDVAALERTLGEITRRHDVLRASFRRAGDQLLQCVAPPLPVVLPIREVTGTDEPQRWADAMRIRDVEWSRAFQLDRDPGVRFELLRVGPDDHVLLAMFHHIVFDGVSYAVFQKELTVLYAAFHRGEPSPLGDLPFQYADFAAWQRELVQLPAGQDQLAYWRKQFEGAKPPFVRGDLPRGPVEEKWLREGPPQVFPAWTIPFELPADLVGLVERQAHQLKVTPFVLLSAAYFILVARESGQDDVILLSSYMGRGQDGTENLLGAFNNPLPLRVQMPHAKQIGDLVQLIRDSAVAQRLNGDLPATLLLGETNKVFRVIFNFLPTAEAALHLPGLEISSPPMHDEDILIHDLALFIDKTDTAIMATFMGNAELFTKAGLQRLVGDYVDLVRWITHSNDRSIGDGLTQRAPTGAAATA